MMGFLHGMLRDPALRSALIAREVALGGVSSGAVVMHYGVSDLRGVLSMREWYHDYVRKVYEVSTQHATGALHITSDIIELLARRWYDANKKILGHNFPWRDCSVALVAEAFSFLPCFITDFFSAHHFGQIVKATTYIPGVTDLAPFTFLKNRAVIDGCFALPWVRFPDNYLLLGFVDAAPDKAVAKHHLNLGQYDNVQENILVRVWIHPDIERADAAFNRGCQNATEHMEDLRAKVFAFLED